MEQISLIFHLFTIYTFCTASLPCAHSASTEGKALNLGQLTSLTTIVTFNDNIIVLVCENVLITKVWILTHVNCRINAPLYAIYGKTILHNTAKETDMEYSRKIIGDYWAEDRYVSHQDKLKHKLGLFLLNKPIVMDGLSPAALVKSYKGDPVTIVEWVDGDDLLYQKLTLRYSTTSSFTYKQCEQKILDACRSRYDSLILDKSRFCIDNNISGMLITMREIASPIFVGDNQLVGFIDNIPTDNSSIWWCPVINIFVQVDADFINSHVNSAQWIE